MILANVRHELGRDDAQLALRLLAAESGEDVQRTEERLREGGIDVILDDPRLLHAITRDPRAAHVSLSLFTYVVVRQALLAIGEDDRSLADYVAAVLVAFGVRGRALRIGDTDDEIYDTLAALMGDARCSDPRRSFLVRAHLGNYALWLSGLFPDFIEMRRWRKGGPDLDYYEEMGRRGFTLAAEHRVAEEHGLAGLFSSAAARFGTLRCALNSVSDSYIFPGYNSPEKLMRQVRSMMFPPN